MDEIKRISLIVIPQAIQFQNVAQTRQKCIIILKDARQKNTRGRSCTKKNMKNVARAGTKRWLGLMAMKGKMLAKQIGVERFDKGVYTY